MLTGIKANEKRAAQQALAFWRQRRWGAVPEWPQGGMARSRGLEVMALAMACLPLEATLSCRDPHYILSGKLILTPFLQQKLSKLWVS